MVYDSVRHRVVLFGGADDTSNLRETWEWDGRTWSDRTTGVAPPTSGEFAMAYDPIRRRTVLFGGFDSAAAPLGTTWEWDGLSWTEHSFTVSPPARAGASMAYDATRQRLVLFGGDSLGDTWELPSKSPTAVLVVSKPGLAPDQKVLGRLVLLGYSVTEMAETALDPSVAAQADLVVLSSSVHPDRITNRLRDVPVPMLSYEGFVHHDNDLSSTPTGETSTGYTQIRIADPSSPLAAGFSGTVTVSSAPTRLSIGTPRGDGHVVATVPGHPNQATVFAYRTGDRLADGTPALAPRVGFLFAYDTPTVTNTNGWKLFDAAVRWLASAPVSTTPHPVAVLVTGKAGQATDGAVFNRLLALGYVVHSMPETALDLTAAGQADLVVLTSSVHPSLIGAKLRGLAVPLLTFEGFLHDDNALSSTTIGETSTGSTQIRIADPASPLAAGLSGAVTVSSAPYPLAIATTGGDAHVVATVPGHPNQATVFDYPAGARLADGTRRARATTSDSSSRTTPPPRRPRTGGSCSTPRSPGSRHTDRPRRAGRSSRSSTRAPTSATRAIPSNTT